MWNLSFSFSRTIHMFMVNNMHKSFQAEDQSGVCVDILIINTGERQVQQTRAVLFNCRIQVT